MIIKVLGPGCAKCVALEKRTRQALSELGRDAAVEKVTDSGQIARYGIMSTPGLVVDERVVLAGRVPTVAALRELLGADPLAGRPPAS